MDQAQYQHYPELSIFLMILSGICWIIVYVDGFRVGIRDNSFAIPFWALALNLAWEVIHAWLSWKIEGIALQVVINALWAIFDGLILYTWFRNGQRYFPDSAGKKWFIPWSLTAITVSFVVQYTFVLEFGTYPGRAYAAFLQNLLMSVLFIDMLVRRESGDGQSMVIAVNKWIGTLAPTILFGVLGTEVFNGPNASILIIGSLCSLFDIIYILMLARIKTSNRIGSQTSAPSRL